MVPGGSRATDTASGGAALIKRWISGDVLEAVHKLLPVAGDLGLTMPQLALAWVLRNQDVASALIGASRPGQITENVRAIDVDLPPEAVAAIDAILAGVTISDPARTAQFTPAARPA